MKFIFKKYRINIKIERLNNLPIVNHLLICMIGEKMSNTIKKLGKVTGNISIINKNKETLSNGTKVYYATIKRNKQGR